MDRQHETNSAPLGDTDSQTSDSPARPRKSLVKRAFRKAYKSVTAPEKDADGQRISIAKSISRRLSSRDGSVGSSSASLLQQSPTSGPHSPDDGARNSPFPKHSGAYSATPPKSTPAVLPKTAHATHRSIKRSSLQLSSARDESEIKGHPQDAPSPDPHTYEPVDAPTGDSHETAIPDPAVPTADSHLSASALVPASPHRPASEPPASEPPVSQTAPASVPEPVPYAESMPQPSETVPQPEQASEKASDKPADPANHAPEEQPNRIDGVIHESLGTYHATATPPGSDPRPVKKPSEAPGTEAKDTSTTKDADAPARRRHVFLSPPKPSTPDPPASDTSEGGRALPPTRMMAANASPGSAASTSREPRAAAVEASAESSAPGDGDQGAEQAATDEQRVERGVLRSVACAVSAVTFATTLTVLTHFAMRARK